jgi:hypothetical protein
VTPVTRDTGRELDAERPGTLGERVGQRLRPKESVAGQPAGREHIANVQQRQHVGGLGRGEH